MVEEAPDKAEQEAYSLALMMMAQEQRSPHNTKRALVEQGIDEAVANNVVERINAELAEAHENAASKNMLYGALWCAGGTVATLADIGYIFWGAIVFGAIQFIKGLYDYTQK